MTLKSDASIELYTIDVGTSNPTRGFNRPINMVPANQTNGKIVRYVNLRDESVDYAPTHMSVSGFEINGSNKLPQPKVTFSNMDAFFTNVNIGYDDLVGFRLIRIRTFARYLERIDGVPVATADTLAHFHPDIWMFNRKMEENNQFCVYELGSLFDVEGIRYPRRRMYSNYCPFVYKGPDCQSTSSLATCGKTLADCKARFSADLRFGGFPTAS